MPLQAPHQRMLKVLQCQLQQAFAELMFRTRRSTPFQGKRFMPMARGFAAMAMAMAKARGFTAMAMPKAPWSFIQWNASVSPERTSDRSA